MSTLALSLSLLVIAPAADELERSVIAEKEFCGQLTFLEPGVKLEVKTELAVPPTKVAALLTDWEALGEIMPMTKVHEVRRSTPDAARIYREMDTPFFLPDVWILIDLERKTNKDVTQVFFKRKDGTPKRFDARWEVRSAAGGKNTLVTYRATLEPPVDPPNFMLERFQRKNIGTMVKNLQKKLGTTSARAPKRCR